MQPFEEAGDVGAAPTIVFGGRAEEAKAQLAVPEALQQVFAAEDGGKEGEVRERRGIERTRRTALAIPHGLDEAVEGPVGRRGIVDDGEGIEIAVVGRRRHGGVAREIRDALGKGCHPRVRRPRRPARRRTLNSYGSLMTVSTRSTQPCLSYILIQLAFIACFTRAPGQRRFQSFRISPANFPCSLRPKKVSTSSARRQSVAWRRSRA